MYTYIYIIYRDIPLKSQQTDSDLLLYISICSFITPHGTVQIFSSCLCLQFRLVQLSWDGHLRQFLRSQQAEAAKKHHIHIHTTVFVYDI